MDLQQQVLLAWAHLSVSPPFSPDFPVEIRFDWDRRSVSFDCQPARTTQRVRWTPVCRIQTKLKVILALSSLHLLKLWEDWQPADCAPAHFLNTESTTQAAALKAYTPASSFKIDIFHVFVLLRNLLSYFPVQPCRLTTKERPLQLWKKFFSKAGRDGNLVLRHSSRSSCAACATHVLRPIRTLFFFIRTIFWDCAYRSVQTLLQQLENTPANGGSVVSRAQVLLLTTWTGFYFFLRQKTEIEHVRRRKQPTVELTALKFKQKQNSFQ